MTIEEIFGHSINSIKELRDGIKELQNSIAGADATSEDFAKTQEKIVAAQAQLNAVTKGTVSANNAATDSIVGMEQEYKKLYNTYKALTEEERKNQFGKETAARLAELSKKLNETKMEVGNFKDNIGHYSEGVVDAFGKMGISMGALQKPFMMVVNAIQDGGKGIQATLGTMTQSIQGIGASLASMGSPAKIAATALKSVGAALKTLIANPVGVIIMAIVLAFKTLKKVVDNVKQAINNNEEAQMALSEAMSAFQPILDAISNAWDAVGRAVVKVIGFIGDAVRWLREAGAAVADFLGITKGANAAIKEQNELYKSLAQSQNALTKQKREYQKLNAKDQAEVERLREEASELDNGAEKRRLLNEAKAKQAEIDARNVEIAKEELRILTEQSKLTANDAAMNDKLAAAEAKVAQEEANAARNARTFNKALKATTTSTNDAANAAKKLAEEAKKVYETTVENNKSELTKLEEKYKKEKKLLEKYGYDTTLLTKQYEAAKQKVFVEAEKKASDEYGKILQSRSKLFKTYYSNLIAAQQGQGTAASTLEVDFAKAQEKKFKELYNAYLSVPKGELEGWEDTAKQVVQTMNDVLGTDLEFPPDLDPESLKLFEENMQVLAKIFKKNVTDAISKNIMDTYNRLLTNQKDFAVLFGTSALSGTSSEYTKNLIEMHRADLEENSFLEQQINNEEISDEARIELRQKYYNVVEEMRQADWEAEELHAERTAKIWEDGFNTVLSSADAVNTILESIVSRREAEIDAQVKEGKISEQTANKQKKALLSYQKVMTAVEVASVAASTAAGIMGVWKAYALEKVANAETAAATGPAAAATLAALNAKSLASAILQTAGLAAAGAAQITAAINGTIAKVSSVNADASSSSSAGVAATPAPIESEPYTYSRTLQTPEDIDELAARPIWVSVEDINSAQAQVQVRTEESSF